MKPVREGGEGWREPGKPREKPGEVGDKGAGLYRKKGQVSPNILVEGESELHGEAMAVAEPGAMRTIAEKQMGVLAHDGPEETEGPAPRDPVTRANCSLGVTVAQQSLGAAEEEVRLERALGEMLEEKEKPTGSGAAAGKEKMVPGGAALDNSAARKTGSLGAPREPAGLKAAVKKKTQEEQVGFHEINMVPAGPSTAKESEKKLKKEKEDMVREALSKVELGDRVRLTIMLDERKLLSEVSQQRLKKETRGKKAKRWEDRFTWWLHKLGSLKALFQYVTWSQSRWLLVRGATKQREQRKEEAAEACMEKQAEAAAKSSGGQGRARSRRKSWAQPDPFFRPLG